ncbi:YadA-like family protein [Gallibacterium anatis]|uniref:YadA-like family protein n=1 Tax=Gallibacterium anatis TaxID=750 RepID=UPI00266F7A8F|nr:YadA-like family protein [Gallibacterium anatis]WKS97124.1 YadA-like family protein [Gallibacterium anatis]
MNKIYKVIFNRNKNRYEIVSELASSRGGKCKVKAGKQIAKLFMTGLLATFLSSVALADEDVKVKYDAATGTIKIVKADESQVLASYAVGGNISSIDSLGTDPETKDTIYPSGVIAIGKDSKAVQTNNIAIGTDAHAGNVGSSDDKTGRIAIGTKTVASGNRSIALGNYSSENNGSYNIVQGSDSIGIGTSTSVFGYSGVSIGRRNIIGVPDPDLVKGGVLTTKSKTKYREDDLGGNSVIVGAYNVAYGNRSNVIGTLSRAMGNNSVAIGSGVQSLSDGAIAIGKGSGYEFDNKQARYARYWELPPEYKVLKQVLTNDIQGDEKYKEGRKVLPKYENYGAGSSDPGGFIVEGKNALGVGSYTQVRGDSAIGLATGEMTADLSLKDKSEYAKAMRNIMDLEEKVYTGQELVDKAKEELEKARSNTPDNSAELEKSLTNAENKLTAYEKELATAKKEFRTNYLSKYSFVEGNGALGVGRQILAKGDRSMAVGDFAKAISNDAIAYGGQTLANGTNSMAMGGNAHVGTEATETTEAKAFDNSMAIGSHTNVQADNAVALGAFSQVTGKNSLALGFGKQSGNDITYNSVSGEDSTLIGSYSNVAGSNSILIGSSGSIANDRVVGLGNNINIAKPDPKDPNEQKNNTAGSVFLGDHAGYVKDSERARSLGKVTLVGSDEKKELTESLSSTKGALRDYTEDFIYIYMLERQDDGTQKIGVPIAVRSDFAGGDSTVGVVSVGSTYEQKFEDLAAIKDYHTKVGSLITVPVEVTVQVSKNGISLDKQQQIRYFAADATQEQIYSDNTLLSDEDKKKVWDAIQERRNNPNSIYTVFETRRIQNVAPGLIGVNSTDAINGSQLFATNQMLGNLVGSLKKTFGDNVNITEDGQISVSGEGTLGWIAKANTVDGSNGKVTYDVDKETDETEEAYQARKAKLQKDGYIVDAAKVMTFKAGKNIGLVQKPGELSISTIDTPSFKSVELRGETQNVDGNKVTPVTMLDSSGMQVYTETVTPGDAGPTTTKKVSTTVNNEGVTTDGTVKVTNGKDSDQAKDLVTIGKNVDPNAPAGTDGENGTIGLDGKNGSSATITVDRGTKSMNDKVNLGTDPSQVISDTNTAANMDRITYTTKGPNDSTINHEVATMDDGLFFSGDSADGKDGNVKNKFDRKLSQETKIVGGVDLGLQADATAEQRKATIAAKLTDGNIGVISDGTDTLTVKLAKQLTGLDSTTYTSPTTGNATSTMKVDGNGVRFLDNKNQTKTDAPSLTTDGITGGGKQITNIDSGLKNGNTTISISDLKDPNKTETINSILNNAVNVSDLKNLVDTGFKLNTSGQPTNSGATTVKIGDTINVVDGANTKVSAIDDSTTGTHTFHIDVNGLPMSYVDSDGNPLTKIGDKFYKTSDLVNGVPPAGTDEVPANKVTSNVSMLDNTGSHTGVAPQIKNVGSGLVDNNGKTIKPNELLNITDTNNPVLKNAVNVGDLKQVAAAAKTEVTGTGAAEVTKKTAKDGHDIYNVHVDKLLTVKPVTPGTLMERGADGKYYAPSEIQDKTFVSDGSGGGSWYAKDDVDEYGTPLEGKSPLAQQPTALDQNTLKTSVTNPNGDGPTIVDNVKSVLDGSTQFIKDLTGLNPTTDANKLNSVSTVSDLQKVALTPLFFEGDTADGKTGTDGKPHTNTFGRKLSETAKIIGGQTDVTKLTDGNIGVVSNGSDTLTIKLAKELKDLDSVKVSNGKDGDDAKDLVTIGKEVNSDAAPGTDGENGTIGLNGKNGSEAVITIDRGTKSLADGKNIALDPTKPVGENNPMSMDRITYTTKGANGSTINHEVATLDDGFFLTTSKDVADSKAAAGVKLNDTIKFTDGANTKVSTVTSEKGVHELHVDVSGLPMTYVDKDGNPLVKVGDKFYLANDVVNGVPKDNAKPVADENVTSNVTMLDKDGKIVNAPQIRNVGSSLVKDNGERISMKDLNDDTAYPDTNPIWNSAVNVKDLKSAVDAATTEVTTSGVAILSTKTANDGHTIYNVHVDPVIQTKGADGSNVVRGDDGKYYKPEEIQNKTYVPNADGNGGNWYNADDVVNGVPKPDAQPQTVKPADIKNSIVNPNSNDSIVLDNVKSGIGGKVVDPEHENKNTFMENVDTIGKANGISENTVVNAGDLKNLVDTGFKLNTSGHSGDAQTVKIGETIKVVDGANTKVSDITPKDGVYEFHIDVTGLPMTYTVSQTGGTDAPVSVSKVGDTYQLADGTKLVKVDDKFYKPSQLVDPDADKPQVKPEEVAKDWTVNDSISLVNKDGSNNAPTTLKNVGSGLKDANGNSTTLDKAVGSNAVNVDDLRTLGKAATTEVTGTGAAEVTKTTGADGQNIYNVHVDKLMEAKSTEPGKTIVRGSDNKYYYVDDALKQANDGKWYPADQVGADGKPADGAVGKDTTELTVVPADKLKNSLVNPNGEGPTVLDNVKSGIGGKVKDAAGNNTFIDNVNKVGKTNPDGSLANDAISENTVVNAKDLKNVVDTGFKLNTSGHNGDAQTVKIGETIKVVDGANTKISDITSTKDGVYEFHIDVTGLPMTYTVSQTGGTDAPVSVSKVGDTYQLADGTKLVKVGDKFYKPSQLVDPKAEQPQVKPEEENKDWTVNDSISLVNKDGSNNAPTLKNVGSGLKDAAGNPTSIDQAVSSNAVNVDDLRTLGKAATTEVTGTGAAEVTKVTGADGQNIYNVHVERFMQVAETDVEGNKVVKAADNYYYKEADIKDKTYIDGQWYNNTDIKDKTKIGDKWYSNTEITDGKANPGATELTVQATTAPNKAVGLQNNLVNPNDNTPTRLSNLASALSGEVGNGANTEDNSAINSIDKNGKPTSESGSNTFVKNVLDLDATVKTEEQLKTSLGHDPSEDEVKAEKARAEKDKALLNSAVTVADLQKTLQSPLFFEGDSADGVVANENDPDKNTFARKLSQKTKIVGGVDLGLKENATADERNKAIAEKLSDNNIGVISNGTDTLTIKLAKNLVNLTSVETGSGNNKTKMTENGITTTVKDGDTFKVTTTTPNGLATTEVKLDSEGMPKGESTTTMVTTDGVTITTQTPQNGDKPASTTETKLSKDGLATDGTVKVTNGKTGDDAKDLVTIAKGTDGSGTDKEYGKIGLEGKNGSNATLTVDRGTKSVTDKANILKDPKQPAGDNNPVSMDRLTYTTTGADGKSIINHEVATLDDGFFLTTEHTEADKTRTVLFNNTIKVLDGANTKVSAMGGEKGTHTFHIDVTGLPVTYTATKTDAKGAPTGDSMDVSKVGDGYQLADGTKLVKVDDKYYKPEQLENNKPKPGEEGLTIKQSVSLVQDNGAPATLERVGSGRRNGMNAKDTPMDWNSILNAAADNAEVNNMLTNAANIGDVRDAIKSITNGTDGNAIGGFGLTGNNGEVKQDLGKTITIKGGIETKHDAATNKDVPAKSTTDKNTYVNVKDVPNADGNGTHKEMVIEIAKDLTDLDSVTVGSVDPTTGKGETTKITGKDVTIKDKAGNTNTSTTTKDELTNANDDKTTVEAGKVDVSKKNADGTTSNTNIDGSKITLENKDKDSNTVGSKTDIGTDGIRITYKDDKGKTDPKKDVSLTDKGLNNGGNQIKNVGSGLVDENGKDITDISNITNSDILSNGVNVGDLQKAINSVTNSSNGGGFGLTGNNGQIMQDLGKTITIKGGIANKKDDSGKDLPAKSTTAQNTYVNVKNNEMVVEIAKDLTDLDSVTIGNVDKDGKGGTVINKDSMTVKDKDGKNSTNIGAGTIGTSKTDGNGNTSSTNINGSHMTLENKDKNGKLTGPKTEVSNKGITITPVDKDGNPIEGKKVELSDTGLDNGGNQIKHVDSGLKKENGDSVKLEDATGDMLNNAVNVGDLQSVNKKLKDDIINISNQVDDIKNSAPVVYVYTNEKGERKRVSKQGDKFVDEDGNPVKPHEIKLSLVNVDGKPSTLQNVAKGVQDTDAVNVKQLKEATEKPLTFNGDAGSSSAKLGETVAIKGGANSADLTDKNIGVIADSSTKTLNVKLSKKLKGLESAEFVDNNGNTTNITGDGVHISGGNGGNVSLTSQGLNNGGNRITNVAPGVEATDAVNVSQLNQVGAALHNRINNVAKGAYGGVASAGAMASLPQAYLPGKSMVAAGASHYRGESAVALGASRISDNGKIILKLNASHNTSGNTMVGAGVGYQF